MSKLWVGVFCWYLLTLHNVFAVKHEVATLEKAKVLLVIDSENKQFFAQYAGIDGVNICIKIDSIKYIFPPDKVFPCFEPLKKTYIYSEKYSDHSSVRFKCTNGLVKIKHIYGLPRYFSHGTYVEEVEERAGFKKDDKVNVHWGYSMKSGYIKHIFSNGIVNWSTSFFDEYSAYYIDISKLDLVKRKSILSVAALGK